MELENRIKEILKMEKFNNLSFQEKEFVFQSILANCLILSKENQERYLDIITNRLVEIVNLKDSDYHKDGYCYGGIVESKVVGPALDPENTIFPLNYYLKYREYSTPLGQMTKSILHEFGHLVIKPDNLKLSNDTILIDLGGLVISKSLKENYGQMFTEIINEFTTFLSYKAFLGYHSPNKDSEEKMREYAENMGVFVDEFDDSLKILPDDLFTSYTEYDLSTDKLDEGTERMFNPLYTKYTPLVRLIMAAFQNPLFSYDNLKREFEKSNGLSAKINNVPVNDLLYGYYESSFHVQDLFDSIIGEKGSWEKFCLEFDSKMVDNKIDEQFVTHSIELFTNFYQSRLKMMVIDGILTNNQTNNKMKEFQQISENCIEYYESIKNKSFL